MKTSTNNLATKSDLHGVEKALKSDIAKVRIELKSDISQFRTELKSDISGVEKRLNQKIWNLDEKIDNTNFNFGQKLTQFKSEIMDVLDKVLHEVLAMRQEQTMHQGVHDRIEERLNNVEEKVGIAPQ